MDALNDVPGIVRRGVQHAVKGEARIVHDVVQLSVLPVFRALDITSLMQPEEGDTHLMVASMTFCGKSSAETSPPTAMASPPKALISSTTSCAFFSSRLALG